tara:strand:+ start:2138 stop:2890 length:753 start_codon:yes stop_codon:yes gene_type:complete
MDPYEVLGLPSNASNREIKDTYKHLAMKTHPDKNKGNEGIFKIIQTAYNTIKRERRGESSCPTTKQTYTSYHHVMPKQSPIQDFCHSKFNSYFKKNSMKDERVGYGKYMQSSGNRESDEDIYKKPVVKTFKTAIVKHRIPDAAEAHFLKDYERLGNDSKDRSTASGFDYMRAHVEVQEVHSKRRAYTNIGELMDDRENVSYEMTETELKKHIKRQEKLKKIEKLRMNKMRSNDTKIEKHYQYINNFLQYK